MRYIWLMGKALVMIPVKVFFYFFPGVALKTSISLEEDKLRSAAAAVGQQKGMINRLERLVKEGLQEVSKLTSAVERKFNDGDEKGARDLALKLVTAKNRLANSQAQLTTLVKSYEENVALIKNNATLINDAKADVKSMEVSLEVAKAKKSQSELAANLKGGLSSSGLLAEARENMQNQIDGLEGEADLANQLSGVDDLGEAAYNSDVDELMASLRAKHAPQTQNHLDTVLVATEAAQSN